MLQFLTLTSAAFLAMAITQVIGLVGQASMVGKLLPVTPKPG